MIFPKTFSLRFFAFFIAATLALPASAALPPDTSPDLPEAREIETLFDDGILPAGDFRPAEKITRDEFFEILSRAKGEKIPPTGAAKMTRIAALSATLAAFDFEIPDSVPRTWRRPDVRPGTWLAPVVFRAGRVGLLPGDESQPVRPFDEISRAEAAKIIARARDTRDREDAAAPSVSVKILNGSSGEFSLLSQLLQILDENYLDPDKIDHREMLYQAAVGLVKAVGDPYTEFLPPEANELFSTNVSGQLTGIGAHLSKENGILRIVAPIDGFPAARAGLRAGDQILAVDGEPTADETAIESTMRIRGPVGSTVTLTISREGAFAARDFQIKREKIEIHSASWDWADAGAKIARLKITQFGTATATEFDAAVDEILAGGARGIVLDLRNNPGGLLDSAVDIASYFLPPESTVAMTENRAGDATHYVSNQNGPLRDLPVAVLVNGGTASAAEILAGALQDLREAPLVGEKTFGKGIAQLVMPFSDGSSLKFTISKWLTPLGRTIHHLGLAPDRAISPAPAASEITRRGAGGAAARARAVEDPDRDAILEAGIEEVKTLLGPR